MENFLKKVPRPILEKAIEKMDEALSLKKEEIHLGIKDQVNNISSTIYEKSKVSTLSLQNILDWANVNNPESECSVSLIKEKSKDPMYPIRCIIVFTKDNNVVGDKAAIIYCKRLDDALYETFGDNDIIEFE